MRFLNQFLATTAPVACLIFFTAPTTDASEFEGTVENSASVPIILPAVSAPNGKLSLQGGSLNDDGMGAIIGSVTLPLGHRYGLQVDGLVGFNDDEALAGGAAHLFWRDPKTGMIGLYGSFEHLGHLDDSHVARVGIEAEYFYNGLTLRGLLGVEGIELDEGFDAPDDGFFAFSDLVYYATDDLALTVGHRYYAEHNALALGIEYQLDQNVLPTGLSLFAEGRLGEDDYQAAWAGVRFHFGGDKSLIARHREDDPRDWFLESVNEALAEDSETIIGGGGGTDD